MTLTYRGRVYNSFTVITGIHVVVLSVCNGKFDEDYSVVPKVKNPLSLSAQILPKFTL